MGEGEELVEGVPVGGFQGRGGYGIDHRLPKLALGAGQGAGCRRCDQEKGCASLP